MKIRDTQSQQKERTILASDAQHDLMPEFINDAESAAARMRLLESVRANQTPKVSASPEPVSVSEEHRTKVEGTTSLTRDISDEEILTRATNNLDEEWVRQDLPSLSIPYHGEQVYLRPFNIKVLARVHAAMKQKNFTLMLDALAHCINKDIRDLTPPDFNFVLYWLRMNSYARTPYTIPWTSKYGNENELRVSNTHLEILELKMSRGDYEQWETKGLCFPTVRDMELLQANDLDEDERWEIEQAQYVYVEAEPVATYVERKIARLNQLGLAAIEDIADFKKLISHGVEETVKVKDEKFNMASASKYIHATVADTRNMIRAVLQGDIAQGQEFGLIGMSQRADALEEEGFAIDEAIAKAMKYEPKEETIAITIDAMGFFP